jgi:hypothetical protein
MPAEIAGMYPVDRDVTRSHSWSLDCAHRVPAVRALPPHLVRPNPFQTDLDGNPCRNDEQHIDFIFFNLGGTLPIMQPDFQRYWVHSVPIGKNITQERINPAFRKIHVERP